ncbi:MAG: hypothetical protein JW863_15695, partial [Chitinispirillaceae bacterium]|nr:hypothetical protein [Chitinispirillaceae bacterium]
MRPRKWVLIVASSILLCVIAFFAAKRQLEKNRHLEDLLTKAVAVSIKGSCTVDAVRIGFFSVYLHNVSVTLPLQSVGIKIGSIKAGLSFSKLFVYRGDLARAINQIILIKPVIDLPLSVPGMPPDSVAEETARETPPPVEFPEPPARYLFVKNGTVRLNNRRGDTTEVAGHLSGKLTSFLDEVSFSLNGRSGSKKNNLSLQGTLSWPRNRHHISVRISDARLGKPFSTGTVTIRSGTLNGVVECTFNNRVDPDTLELHGWLRLAEGNARLQTPDLTADSLITKISLEKGICLVDTFSCRIRGMHCTAGGRFRCTKQPSVNLKVACDDFTPDSLTGLLPPEALSRISGTGTMAAVLQWQTGSDAAIAVSTGGYSLGALQAHRIDAHTRLSGSTLIADSLFLETPWFTSRLQGYYNSDTSGKSYDLSFSLISDSLPDSTGVNGVLRAIGTVTGTPNGSPDINCRLTARELSYRHLYLGNPQLVLQLRGKRCTFSSVKIDSTTPVSINGSIDSVFSTAPIANITLSVESGPIKEQLKRMHGMPT